MVLVKPGPQVIQLDALELEDDTNSLVTGAAMTVARSTSHRDRRDARKPFLAG